MGLSALLERLLRGAPPPITTRLSEAEVIEIARRAAADHWLSGKLDVATPKRAADGAVVWQVQTTGLGSFLQIVIDDASGNVLERRAHEGR